MRWLDHLDPQIAPLINFFQEKNILTLPSCAGHYRTNRWCDKAFGNLRRDEEIIKKEGLPLIDVETGETLKFKKRDWSLPFNKKQFAEAARGSEGIPEGYLALGESGDDVIHGLNKAVTQTPCCRLIKRPSHLELRVFGGSQQGQNKAWGMLSDCIKKHVK
jgi:hypothetical protein